MAYEMSSRDSGIEKASEKRIDVGDRAANEGTARASESEANNAGKVAGGMRDQLRQTSSGASKVANNKTSSSGWFQQIGDAVFNAYDSFLDMLENATPKNENNARVLRLVYLILSFITGEVLNTCGDQ
ncbi:uncharacterized protein [Physcomitrium patens]|uniref:Uncharacterized protein n=1 Tax=Physcomitrium patens TaxID=3218 RepID=A0A7I4AVG5_PHYPA|nr:uncharacterized protein LOC112290931 isoform X2 [Physcomitrium patens]XP_024393542.1 uncharacterized protein LOC112290931 isoform X2 [Physcomitrium patens]|eukprot:XP_024393541.1 uncharacterized protein LOC112290931 isoform X2 [Physcomitrella patens]